MLPLFLFVVFAGVPLLMEGDGIAPEDAVDDDPDTVDPDMEQGDGDLLDLIGDERGEDDPVSEGEDIDGESTEGEGAETPEDPTEPGDQQGADGEGDAPPVEEPPVEEPPVDEGGGTEILTGADETFEGTESTDQVFGFGGDDSISGLGGNDYVEGNLGDDTLLGGIGNDTLLGGGGTDQIDGGDGDDLLSADRFDEFAIFSRGEAETLSGGAGNDQLVFSGNDIVTGGEGNDQFGMVVADEGPAVVTDFLPGEDTLTLFVEGLNQAAVPPEVLFEQDIVANTTTISIGGAPVVTLEGLFDSTEVAPILRDQADLFG